MLHKNVTHGTTGSSPEHNGLPSATNVQRLAEIRARLDAARNEERIQRERTDKGVGWNPPCGCGEAECGTWDEWYPVKHHEGDLYENAPADIAWLLALAEALIEQIEFLKDDVSRIAAQRDRYKKRWHGESA
jgi:uncharacterized small protein (DUF1192 family)